MAQRKKNVDSVLHSSTSIEPNYLYPDTPLLKGGVMQVLLLEIGKSSLILSYRDFETKTPYILRNLKHFCFTEGGWWAHKVGGQSGKS